MMFEELKGKINDTLLKEEAYWRQRSKTYWLRDGDRNTKYFHAVASSRKRQNSVKKLRKEDDTYAETQEEICEVARLYFSELFLNHQGTYDTALDTIQPCISEVDNLGLAGSFYRD